MADTVTRREVLEFVARGELSPQDAADILARLETDAPTDPAGTPDPAAAPPRPAAAEPGPTAQTAPSAPTPVDLDPADSGDPIQHVHVRTSCRSVIVLGDEDVQRAVADGEHTARIDGDTMTIEALLDRVQGFSFIRTGPPLFRARSRVRVGERANALVVRMNPHLAMTATVEAGSMNIHGVLGPIAATVHAGALVAEGIQSPFDVKVAAGQATLTGRMSSGTSRIECDAGQVAVLLTPDSSVRIHAKVNLGQLHAPEQVGSGDATLNVVANLGAVDIAVQEQQ